MRYSSWRSKQLKFNAWRCQMVKLWSRVHWHRGFFSHKSQRTFATMLRKPDFWAESFIKFNPCKHHQFYSSWKHCKTSCAIFFPTRKNSQEKNSSSLMTLTKNVAWRCARLLKLGKKCWFKFVCLRFRQKSRKFWSGNFYRHQFHNCAPP